ncbi:MAG: IS701 family transposase, partial [Desulfobacteraceae bacterium]|nr:IS701 family transposase [Desulfobacteraceae bacterium]
MNDNLSDLYIDYLISSFGATTATGLSSSVGGSISHDKIPRMLSRKPRTSADLWRVVKPLIRQMESPEGVPITDDSKPPTDGNGIICRHYDRCSGRNVKGISFMTALYHSQ